MSLALIVTQSFVLACIIVAARAGLSKSADISSYARSDRSGRSIALPWGCMYEDRWHAHGEVIPTYEVCLHCVCDHGALSCRRRSCPSLPEVAPQQCQVIHKKGNCCPELQCPDGVVSTEYNGVTRSEDISLDAASPASLVNACVEGGTVYAAGSAMSSSIPCEQCFCLGAIRRCVKPQCLPPPPGCRPRPASGVCCPQKYYCEHTSTIPPEERKHDCMVNAKWVPEGERVLEAESSRNCSQCFCLFGAVRCQPLACAPVVLGCKPLLRPGECCAHRYHCQHQQESITHHLQEISDNALLFTNYKNRSFSKYQRFESTQKPANRKINQSLSSVQHFPTIKVKRKTNDSPPSSSQKPVNQRSTTLQSGTKITLEDTTTPITELTTEKVIEQPESTIKITINGTINCTTEISSSTIPVNKTLDDRDKIKMDIQPRVPIIDIDSLDDHTFSPNDIITEKNLNGFDENETFTINVTSSLATNANRSTRPPIPAVSEVALPADLPNAMNVSKKTKGDYDYDYTEATLPPSLPNLKIIPFVAADAVVDDEPEKKALSYPMLEREDKFPVYYPSTEAKRTPFATKKSDFYNPSQYPMFTANKESAYPSLTNEDSEPIFEHSNNQKDLEYSVVTSFANRKPEANEAVTKPPVASPTFEVKTPAINLFSPPVETEGGFVPKAPESIDDYYSPYPSTPPPASSVPHLTTSMQLDITKGECLSSDGRHVSEGKSIHFACSECTCAWGELHCSPLPCQTPAGCRRRSKPAAAESCCGQLICDEDNKSTLNLISIKDVKFNNNKKEEIDNVSITIATDVKSYPNSSKENSIETEAQVKTKEQNSTSKGNNVETVTDYLYQGGITSLTELPTAGSMIMTSKPQLDSIPLEQANQTVNNSQEYEDDDDDEGFSFGSVLKLLLSESYATTKSPSHKIASTETSVKSTFMTTTRSPAKQTIKPFIPLPPRTYNPPSQAHTSVSRIDHLVLGEATAIRSTVRPTTAKATTIHTTPETSIRPLEITKKETQSDQYTSITHEGPRPPSLGGLGAGLLKLAGCNIYGRMYRVGRIITELSTPCQECWCTELGVQCKPLKC